MTEDEKIKMPQGDAAAAEDTSKEDILTEESAAADAQEGADAEENADAQEGADAKENADAQESADARSEETDANEEADVSDDAAEENVPKGRENFFKKNKKDKKDKKDEQIEELTDKYKRTMAEFDNFRKRTELEKSAMYEIGARDIIEKILPVKDNFERGLAAIPESDRESAIAVGMDKIYKQLDKVLTDLGVTEIEAEGVEFNPELHNAVMHIEDESLGDNVIAEVFEKGYTYKGKVVRHSMVKVAN